MRRCVLGLFFVCVFFVVPFLLTESINTTIFGWANNGTSLNEVRLSAETQEKLAAGRPLTRRERNEIDQAEKAKYIQLREMGVDEVSHTEESAALRAYRLRKKKRKGIILQRETSLAEVLFPGVSPEEYNDGESISVYADLVESRKRLVPYNYYDLPGCPIPEETYTNRRYHERRNLGSRLQGHAPKVAPFNLQVKRSQGCTPICTTELSNEQIRWIRHMIKAQYRVQLKMDMLPVLMRSKEYNYVVRGYPIGFNAPTSFKALKPAECYMFNHLKFTITYHDRQDTAASGHIRIIGFDVFPMSIKHDMPESGDIAEKTTTGTCDGKPLLNEPGMYLDLPIDLKTLNVMYSYEVEWIRSELRWADRWDVYLLGAPDDDMRYYSLTSSILFLTGMIMATTMLFIRLLRKNAAVCNEINHDELGSITNGWKVVPGNLLRPLPHPPLLLCGLVGPGMQICIAFGLTMFCGTVGFFNPVEHGATLTTFLQCYALCGCVGGYFSTVVSRHTAGEASILHLIISSTTIPFFIGGLYIIMNAALHLTGAATALDHSTLGWLFLYLIGIPIPMFVLGVHFGIRTVSVPSSITMNPRLRPRPRVVPITPIQLRSPSGTIVVGGLLAFHCVWLEFTFVMSCIWLHQLYYSMVFLLVGWLLLVVTCVLVSIGLTYIKLRDEVDDYRRRLWWMVSFYQCASGGVYMFLYSFWYMNTRLDMVDDFSYYVYMTYMVVISICFGLSCGSVSFVSALWFRRYIDDYDANVKVNEDDDDDDVGEKSDGTGGNPRREEHESNCGMHQQVRTTCNLEKYTLAFL